MENQYLIVFEDPKSKKYVEYCAESNLAEKISEYRGEGFTIISVNLIH